MLWQVLNFVAINPEKTEQQAKSLTNGIQNSEHMYSIDEIVDFTLNDLHTVFNNWKNEIDYQ